ncbi:PREDICTED: uncharacterized protein LOC109239557 [Nicotiana attenuata]|uniref:uncharacterized protein LOC109239557 n=1 Tax=Nicotiana attenuata TaxID=49451 RepID=UPI0009055731|nr:PREDICTED: uncharacterized protein LOC109239557 [Nicotiana attenuata]
MEYLTRSLKNLKDQPNFNYHPRCEKMGIIQLSFADDLLLFCRGDRVFVQLLYECFNSFSQALGLVANQKKSSIYFGGVSSAVQQEMTQITGFSIGELPFRYLGVPLSTKKLSVSQCQPLLDKMLGRIKQWTVKFLSYAGRVQLIKSVLIAIQSFWSQIFPLPKKIIQQVESICRKFLWTGDTSSSTKALVTWDMLCRPKTKGGLNVTDLNTWNRAALLKHLWNLGKKKDKLWIKWVHAYYIKGREPWEVDAKQASRIVRKILQAGKYLTEAWLDTGRVVQADSFSIRGMYKQLRGEFPKVNWSRLLCNNRSCPKWKFILYLAVQGNLYTKDRLIRWGMQVSPECPMCEHEMESHNHIFFTCTFSEDVWRRLLKWMDINREPKGWNGEIKWAIEHVKGNGSKTMLYRLCMTGVVYHIWLERNRRLFQKIKRSSEDITRQIVRDIHCIGYSHSRLRNSLQKLNYYP